jgi:hypothetical protein
VETVTTLILDLHHLPTATLEETVMNPVQSQDHLHQVLAETAMNQNQNLATTVEVLPEEIVMSRVPNQDHLRQATHHQEAKAMSQNLSLATMVGISITQVQADRPHQHHQGVVPETAAVAPVAGKAVK